jgi:hypothetical protein
VQIPRDIGRAGERSVVLFCEAPAVDEKFEFGVWKGLYFAATGYLGIQPTPKGPLIHTAPPGKIEPTVSIMGGDPTDFPGNSSGRKTLPRTARRPALLFVVCRFEDVIKPS